MRLLSHDGRVLRGREGLWVYRVLFTVSPQVYATRLAHVLVRESHSAQVAQLPAARRALLQEAVAAALVLPEGYPYRAKVLGQALQGLAQLGAPEETPQEAPQGGGA